MKILINLVLVALIAFLSYLLYANIQEPIKFRNEKEARLEKVTARLEQIRSSQEIFQNITGKFANDFDTLALVLKNDSIPFVKMSDDPKFPGDPEHFIKEITYSMAIDTINKLGINLDSLKFVPFGQGKKYSIEADTMTYQKTLVQVVEVGTRWKDFMGKYADAKYSKYDKSYKPNAMVKFGDLNKPSLAGSWGR